MEKGKLEKNTLSSDFRPPIVAVLGHVDHGKTSLLDAIRKSDIAGREHGGITQKIGASTVEFDYEGEKRKITFIDTPGHEAFSNMRSRSSQAADMALLVVSSTEGIKPQTKESLDVLKKTQTPFIVVLTKADLPEKNPEKVKQQLLKEGISLEGYGGEVPALEVSAKTGKGISELLHLIVLFAQLNEIGKSDGDSKGLEAVVIESRLDPQKGPVASVVVKKGLLKTREKLFFEFGEFTVRGLINEKAKLVSQITVGEAGEVLGFDKTPAVGSLITDSPVFPTAQPRDKESSEIFSDERKLSIVLSADTLGSLEAVIAALPEDVSVVQKKTGPITAADVLTAKSTGAIIVGFNVKLVPEAQKLASAEKVIFRVYNLIYELIDEIKDVAEAKKRGMLKQILGRAKILAEFTYEKQRVIGIKVLEGRVAKGDKVSIVKEEESQQEGTVVSLREGKADVTKVSQDQEAGIIVSPPIDFTIGDMLIFYN